MIAQAVQGAAGSMEELAGETGVTYASLKAWVDGRRNPSPANLVKLADALERRGGEVVKLAEALRKEAGK